MHLVLARLAKDGAEDRDDATIVEENNEEERAIPEEEEQREERQALERRHANEPLLAAVDRVASHASPVQEDGERLDRLGPVGTLGLNQLRVCLAFALGAHVELSHLASIGHSGQIDCRSGAPNIGCREKLLCDFIAMPRGRRELGVEAIAVGAFDGRVDRHHDRLHVVVLDGRSTATRVGPEEAGEVRVKDGDVVGQAGHCGPALACGPIERALQAVASVDGSIAHLAPWASWKKPFFQSSEKFEEFGGSLRV